jgi:2-dehydro-3-deoxyphosphogluconate aldolase/(4S)-4-hydroxy-2-oxoglutarate aldolase
MDKFKISETITKPGMVPVFYHEDLETCKKVIKACYDGGLRVFEYTNRGEKAAENFPLLKQFISESCEGMLLGIGSVINGEQTEQFISLGADFIVSPILEEEVAETCNEKDMYWIPGCATLSEIAKAEKLGADIIKVFPGNVLGPGFVKAVKGPMKWLKLMPTGGVTPEKENLSAWFGAGVVCVGMGSQLLNKESIKDTDSLTKKVSETIELIDSIRNS